MIQPIARWPNVATFILVVIASLSFATHRSGEEARVSLAASDRAFDNGDLKRSMLEARATAMSALPKSTYLRASLERLSAIAVGSESAGRTKTALLSRMSLLSLVQSRGAKFEQSLVPQSSEQIRFLLDKVAAPTTSERINPGLLMIDVGASPGLTCIGLFLGALVAGVLSAVLLPRWTLSRFASWVIPAAAMVAWFAAWFTA